MSDRKLFLSFPLLLEPGGFSLIHKKRERKKRKKARDKISTKTVFSLLADPLLLLPVDLEDATHGSQRKSSTYQGSRLT